MSHVIKGTMHVTETVDVSNLNCFSHRGNSSRSDMLQFVAELYIKTSKLLLLLFCFLYVLNRLCFSN